MTEKVAYIILALNVFKMIHTIFRLCFEAVWVVIYDLFLYTFTNLIKHTQIEIQLHGPPHTFGLYNNGPIAFCIQGSWKSCLRMSQAQFLGQTTAAGY